MCATYKLAIVSYRREQPAFYLQNSVIYMDGTNTGANGVPADTIGPIGQTTPNVPVGLSIGSRAAHHEHTGREERQCSLVPPIIVGKQHLPSSRSGFSDAASRNDNGEHVIFSMYLNVPSYYNLSNAKCLHF